MRDNITYCPVCKTELQMKEHEDRQRLICPGCGWVNYENPLPGVAAFVRNAKGEIMLIKRDVEPAKGEWALPTGFMEVEETPQQTLHRELKEETNMEGKIVRLIGVYNEFEPFYKNVIVITYEVESTSSQATPGSDCSDLRFFEPDKLPQLPFKSHYQIIKDGLHVNEKR